MKIKRLLKWKISAAPVPKKISLSGGEDLQNPGEGAPRNDWEGACAFAPPVWAKWWGGGSAIRRISLSWRIWAISGIYIPRVVICHLKHFPEMAHLCHLSYQIHHTLKNFKVYPTSQKWQKWKFKWESIMPHKRFMLHSKLLYINVTCVKVRLFAQATLLQLFQITRISLKNYSLT